jgi:hypothetical protein
MAMSANSGSPSSAPAAENDHLTIFPRGLQVKLGPQLLANCITVAFSGGIETAHADRNLDTTAYDAADMAALALAICFAQDHL